MAVSERGHSRRSSDPCLSRDHAFISWPRKKRDSSLARRTRSLQANYVARRAAQPSASNPHPETTTPPNTPGRLSVEGRGGGRGSDPPTHLPSDSVVRK